MSVLGRNKGKDQSGHLTLIDPLDGLFKRHSNKNNG